MELLEEDASDKEIITLFVIEDSSPLGSSCVDNNNQWRTINLAFCKEFLEIIKESPKLDCVMAMSKVNGAKEIWFIDRTVLDEYFDNCIDYSNYRFMGFKPHCIYFIKEI